jgi:hypothetical protein
MFNNQTWISNEYKKIKNPTKFNGTTDKYQGILNNDFDFKYQKDNFEKIKASVEPFGIYPNEIYFANRANKSMFVVTWTNPNLFWYKYEGESYGSGQNYIYWKQNKHNTSRWISYNTDTIGLILNNDLTQGDLFNLIN